ncbi:MAG: PilZ domain-containing protein [Deltaproteobacteria bacterium]|nr:PilZ domain-containing protein [Deltaproteobacteria bacterium]
MNLVCETERRKHRRLELTHLVAYKSFDIEAITETLNISIGGMKIRTDFPVGKSEILHVSLRIGSERFESQARVIYCNPQHDQAYEMGLAFENTSDKDLALLGQYLRSQSRPR